MENRRFNIGDKVTYKSKKDCISNYSRKGYNHHYGEDQDGFVGEVVGYYGYNDKMGCYNISVRFRYGEAYMLECYFLEYDKPFVSELFPIY